MTALFGYIAGVALGANVGQSSISHEIWPQAITKILAVEFLMMLVSTSVRFIAGNSSSGIVYLLFFEVTIINCHQDFSAEQIVLFCLYLLEIQDL
jgi:hypothetical protein